MKIDKGALVIVCVIVFAIIAVKVAEIIKPKEYFESDASRFVLDDLKNKYPNAELGILKIEEKSNNEGAKYFQVKSKVVMDQQTKCPKRSHIYYNYPAQNFVGAPPEYITKNCTVCTEGICNIAFEEEALIASHYLDRSGAVSQFIGNDATHQVIENQGNWSVTWTNSENQKKEVGISRDGKISQIRRI